MGELHILRPAKGKTEVTHPRTLPKCPICGGRAYIMHDIVDGFDFGWSVGCARACIGDKHHKLNDYEKFEKARIVFHNLHSKEQAIKIWEERCNNGSNNQV